MVTCLIVFNWIWMIEANVKHVMAMVHVQKLANECFGGWINGPAGDCSMACLDEDGNPLCGGDGNLFLCRRFAKMFCKPVGMVNHHVNIIPGINPITKEGFHVLDTVPVFTKVLYKW